MDIFQAMVVCKQLGFTCAIEFKTNSFFGSVPSTFSYDDVTCLGSEDTLDECMHSNKEHDCASNKGAGVVCGRFGNYY